MSGLYATLCNSVRIYSETEAYLQDNDLASYDSDLFENYHLGNSTRCSQYYPSEKPLDYYRNCYSSDSLKNLQEYHSYMNQYYSKVLGKSNSNSSIKKPKSNNLNKKNNKVSISITDLSTTTTGSSNNSSIINLSSSIVSTNNKTTGKIPSMHVFLNTGNNNHVLTEKEKQKKKSVYHYTVRRAKKLSKINGKSIEQNFDQIMEEQQKMQKKVKDQQAELRSY